MADESAQIQTNALAPATVSSDGLTVTQQPIAAQIQADQYAAAAAGVKSRNRGMRFSKLLPAGPMSDQQANRIGRRCNFF
jgi:hypothetical protein